MNGFSKYHPAVIFIYFVAVTVITVFVFDPVLLGITFISQSAFYLYLKGMSEGISFVGKCLGIVVICGGINALVNHRGVTVLCWIGELPLTVECLFYGCMTGTLLAASLLMFGCCSQMMTSEKILCLFGNRMPHACLLFSMALRLIPKIRRDYKMIRENHKLQKGILTTLVGLALEDSLEMGTAMRDRGYGKRLKGKRRTSIYTRRFQRRDLALMVCLLLAASIGMGLHVCSRTRFLAFPYMEYSRDGMGMGAYFLFALLFFIPLGINIREELRWRHIVSKI
ncbi:MAG: hypothetical protein HFG34_10065 [Eubacterium sp.]|nr:hypothetical protein [Eubacterium sp.]